MLGHKPLRSDLFFCCLSLLEDLAASMPAVRSRRRGYSVVERIWLGLLLITVAQLVFPVSGSFGLSPMILLTLTQVR